MLKTLNQLKKYEWTSYILFTLYVLGILFLLWIVASYLNILAHNTLGDETYQYWTFNFFNLFQ